MHASLLNLLNKEQMETKQAIAQYEAHTTNITRLGLHIKLIGNNVADVFSGEGFGVPSRLRKVKGQWVHVTGPKLSSQEQLAVVTAIS
jgi:hypothetical protein